MTTLAVVLASAGRPALLAEAIATCRAQKGVDFVGVVSVPDGQSLPKETGVLDGWHVVTGTRGLAAQRNAGIDAIEHAAGKPVDLVAFFDDDAVLREDYLAAAVAFFDAHPSVVALTGRVLLDGAVSGEVPPHTAFAVLDRSWRTATEGAWKPARELYGCNFVVRLSIALRLRFDERLPLYSWLEDHDFARRCMPTGTLAKVDDCVIVHRAAASGGRQAHERLGYSQVMNPVYLNRKGSFPVWLTVYQIVRPVAKNLVLSVAGPVAEWRRERLRGNGKALLDIKRGRLTPERIVDL